MADEKRNTQKEKTRFPVLYVLILFLSAALLIMLALQLKLRDELSTAKTELKISRTEIDLLEDQLKDTPVDQVEKTAKAIELLTLAQDSFYKKDSISFHAYMAMLEGYADMLPENAIQIYEELTDALS